MSAFGTKQTFRNTAAMTSLGENWFFFSGI
jgi:hypothetical protein